MSVAADTATPAPSAERWDHEPLDETLHGARELTTSVVDEVARGGWEAIACYVGIPARRWRRFHPAPDGSRIVARVAGHPAFNASAWERLASLAPGAISLPTRTAATFGVAPQVLRPPHRTPRLVDLWQHRRARRAMRRRERTLVGDHATFRARLQLRLAEALAEGDDGTPFEQLPAYALAARLESLVRDASAWTLPPAVDLSNAHATAVALRQLGAAGRSPGAALLELAARTPTSGTVERQAAQAADPLLGPWFAARDLLLEAPPLGSPRQVAPPDAERDTVVGPAPDVDDDDGALADVLARASRLAALREQCGRDRADLHAALRALAWTLARRLHDDGTLPDVDAAFDLSWRDLVLRARGASVSAGDASAASTAPPPGAAGPAAASPASVPSGGVLRGIPASHGIATGPPLVLDAPNLDEDVAGHILVCRMTDPAWMPLLMRCAGLVTERGGPLSHAAIVARELGLPTVVAVPDARAAIDGAARLDVDGGAGTVTVVRDR